MFRSPRATSWNSMRAPWSSGSCRLQPSSHDETKLSSSAESHGAPLSKGGRIHHHIADRGFGSLLSMHRASLSQLSRRRPSPCALPSAAPSRPTHPRLACAAALPQTPFGEGDILSLRHPSAPHSGGTGVDSGDTVL